MLRPRPVPLPTSLVVKNGSKTRASTSGGMPVPVSRDREHARSRPAPPRRWRRVVLVELDVARSRSSAAAARHGVAGVDGEVEQRVSRAGRGRPRPASSPASSSVLDLDRPRRSVPAQQARAMPTHQRVEVERLRLQRLPAREGEQLLGQRGAALGRRRRSSRRSRRSVGRPSGQRSAASRALPMMTVSRLLKSCATPPVSWPTASIFCAWRSCASASRSAVTSRRNADEDRPSSYVGGIDRQLDGNSDPSALSPVISRRRPRISCWPDAR